MLDRYRTHQSAPAAPEAQAKAGAETTAQVRAAPAAPVAPAGISKARAVSMLEALAVAKGIDWTAARSQMIEGDREAGTAQLAADSGDGVEAAGVAFWLRLLAERATPTYAGEPDARRHAVPAGGRVLRRGATNLGSATAELDSSPGPWAAAPPDMPEHKS